MQTSPWPARRPFLSCLARILAPVAAAAALAGPAAAQQAGRLSAPPIATTGCSGLLRIPTAEVLPYGDYAVGINTMDHRHRPYPGHTAGTVAHFVTVGVLPRLEVAAVFTNNDGRLGAQFKENVDPGVLGRGGWNFDRMFSVQALLLPQTKRLPVSVGAGYQDVFGTGVYRSSYLVFSHRSFPWGLHAGVAFDSPWMGTFFGGVDYQVHPNVRLMLDDDGRFVNLGASLDVHHFSITPILTGLNGFGAGLAYNSRL